ncbi:MAG TPA: carbamoyl-phosphate synthase large subunit [Thermoleophilia bacterium]|nr:carbamoyl-phosphate synthase large subunit [Thermoleophilia bacterium]HQG03179.1 carbamoyl-phosphate synthase large subunit [Thermoleophilia bacterium]HQJ96992.1 carbamoyl-phosphate synthase large subunit [Thermoleophilia bacterium]
MPRRDDLRKILIIGSGPIVVGQACEFDYSGTQACKVLLEEGYEVVLVNSNPATIMTDPDMATRTYVEPLDVATLTRIIETERPDALLPTLGGQTALNLATELDEAGVLDLWEVETIGADIAAIRRAEDREAFRAAMEEIGLRVPRSVIVRSLAEAEAAADELGLPLVVRPAYTLGGRGGGIAHDGDALRRIVAGGLRLSPISQVMLEESVAGWHEFELEVMRDKADNVVVVCSIENVDPMGVHTGDSVTVAPALTLTDPQYQELRDAAKAIVRKIGVDTGGSNVQFAVHPGTGEVVVIEMNPRVSRSSALASKATGFPIAKIAARLAIGYTLDEITNDITGKTPASFEPTLDYVVVKMPRWAFEKFPLAERELTTHMKSVGEVMAIGRTFKEAFLKALRSRELETPRDLPATKTDLARALAVPCAERHDLILQAFRAGMTVAEVQELTMISPFFLAELRDIVELEDEVRQSGGLGPDLLRRMKRYGFSDRRLGELTGRSEREVRALRLEHGVTPVFKAVDTCAAEFAAETPYYYSTYEDENEASPGERERVVILGSGPNRIGQGIEFDYCCVHAAMTARAMGYEAVMVNCNPETVSTDYDTSDRLYVEPLTFEDVMNVVVNERPKGVIVQFGGQTPLRIAADLDAAGVPILGTPQSSIDLAEDRGRFGALLPELGIRCPEYGLATTADEAAKVADEIGFPVLVRPSYVLGGRAMEIVYTHDELVRYMESAARVSPDHPVLIDRFLEDAIEVDVDALSDGEDVYVGAVMQHVEEAGVHSGDSACVIPSLSLGEGTLEQVRRQTRQLAVALGVRGLINVQFAFQDYRLYVLEVNPRGSRTVPFVSKATGVQLAKLATRVILGERVRDFHLPDRLVPEHVSVKEAVLPFDRFPGSDTRLGPEMKSTGEVMGIADDFPTAFGKAHAAVGAPLPLEGSVFLSVCDSDKSAATILAQRLHALGFTIYATRGTATALTSLGIPVRVVNKVFQGEPHVVNLIAGGEVVLVINTPFGRSARSDGYEIRTAALERGIPSITTLAGASAAVSAIEAARRPRVSVRCLQDLHATMGRAATDGPWPGMRSAEGAS